MPVGAIGYGSVALLCQIAGGGGFGGPDQVFNNSYIDPNGKQTAHGAGLYYDDNGSFWGHYSNSTSNTDWSAINTGPPIVLAAYFNGAVDDSWNTLGNWWGDAGHTQPATQLPQAGGTVTIEANVHTPPTVPVALTLVTVTGVLIDVDLTNVTSVFVFNGSSINGTGAVGNPIGNATFNGTSKNTANITGTATFNNSAKNDSTGTVNGDASFSTGNNDGTVTGNAAFASSNNNGTVGGNATFNGSSGNFSIVTGNATFNNTSGNGGGSMVGGNAVFNNTSNCAGAGVTIAGNAIFNGDSVAFCGSSIGGVITWNSTTVEPGTADPPAPLLSDLGGGNYQSAYNGFAAEADTHVAMMAQINGGGYNPIAENTPIGASIGDVIDSYQIDKCSTFNVNSASPPGPASISSVTLA